LDVAIPTLPLPVVTLRLFALRFATLISPSFAVRLV